jgi:hypothetical protein
MQKKLIISLVFLIMAVVGISGCTDLGLGNETTNESSNLTTYAENGISFQYPSEWSEYNGTEDDEIVYVGNYSTYTVYSNDSSDSISSSSGIYVDFYKYNKSKLSVSKQLSNLKSHSEFKNKTYGNKTINGINATTVTGTSVDNDNNEYKSMYVIFEKGDYSYAIIVVVYPPEDFGSYQGDIDTVLNSFQITG